MEHYTSEVRRNNSNGQKLLTVPKNADIFPEDKVMLVKLGKNWERLPNHLKAHKLIEEALNISNEARRDFAELDEVKDHLREASEYLGFASRSLEKNKTIYGEMSASEIQEACEHERIVKRNEGHACTDCGKILEVEG